MHTHDLIFIIIYYSRVVFLHTLAYSADNNIYTFQGNGNKEDGLEVPVPQALLNTIGQTHKFNVKVTEHNLSGRTRVITVTKVLSPSAPPSIPEPVADPIIGSGNEILATGDDFSEPSKIPQACADVGLKRMGDGVEKGNPKRSKDGN